MSQCILLTGGLGYIGSHAASVLASEGYEVVLLDNLSNSNVSVISRLTEIIGKELPFVEGDVRDQVFIEDVLMSYGIDAVIHFAGLKAVGESVRHPLKYFLNNVSGTLSLLRAMKRLSINKFVFSSSATVYGVPHYMPLDEGHPRKAINPYGKSKVIVEEMLEDIAASDPSFRVACLRYFNPVGAHPSGLIGENPKGIPGNLIPFIAKVLEGEVEYLSVFGGDYETCDGTGVRDYIHVMDLVEGHISALEYLNNHPGFHVFNLGTGMGHSVLEMISAYEDASGKKIPYKIVGRRAGDVAACYADPGKAKKLLGWKARRDLSIMCESSDNYYRCLVKRTRV
ncbi:UDP-glucose 4-epimerase GalE [Methylophaga sp.]|uniref:UDP-glucose 4-epimerase GalE n=1 Tax=Methylophaga sp. TaxID=2024840 RepID=UPI003A934604